MYLFNTTIRDWQVKESQFRYTVHHQPLWLKAVEIITENAIATALRGHFLLESVLRLQIITSAIKTLHQSVTDVESLAENIINCKIMEKVNGVMDQMMGRLCTFIPYSQTLNTVYLLHWHLQIVYCCWKNWKLAKSLGITAKILSLFTVTGHLNYAKKARLYLQIMNDLPSTYLSSSNATGSMFLDGATDFGTEFGRIWSLNWFWYVH